MTFHNKIDLLGIFLNINVAIFSLYPLFLSTLVLYFEFDPIYNFAKFVVHLDTNSLFVRIFIFPLRLVQVPPTFQIARLFALLICMITLSSILFLDAIHELDLWGFLVKFSRRKADLLIRRYLQLAVALQHVADFFAMISAILMMLGLVLCVLFNFMSVKLYGLIPMPLYLFFPSVTVLIPLIIDTLLPFGIRINETSVRFRVKCWRNLKDSCDRKYLRRRLSAIRPLCFDCGVLGFTFLKFTKSMQIWFYEQILSYTITALLSDGGIEEG
ncbi:hypothetical protein Fcan01_17043 [Folsomia candida]|uniref:Uncharacterized protein n=1 Tax=Folsomia candida TaxID=158441 RepID=A0A226DSD5_FOLCA|nr:hypothetical protein Fcan01_17043 [Folsomia candida]